MGSSHPFLFSTIFPFLTFFINKILIKRQNKKKGGEFMSKKGINDSSIEQVQKDHETKKCLSTKQDEITT